MILVCVRWIVLVFLLGARGQVFQVHKVLQQFGNMASDTAGGAFQLFGDTVSVITGIGRKEIEQRVADVGIKIVNRSDLKVSKDESDDNASHCYGPLGCLEISEKWYSLTRPVNMMPQPRQVINTQFILTPKAWWFSDMEWLSPWVMWTSTQTEAKASRVVRFLTFQLEWTVW